ncbi:MAG: hypothetical protein A3B99_01300 [Candidatus Yanofskybacteria bacterium RIFCSPHIGHO2_02_FULL_44_12b]|nr:MAG: hypothetical protein A3B99_01300 [Candidatus Yanofskybacteria bacterium RIFCSPHIGHO2_02_FULL_44_12b]OHA63820.1 MAG: hypothetical protein A2842_00975 [Candidatus Wildermuthbacteria bacterium RIFCSPHIGHO2_01_FULL_48_25]
MDKLYRKYRAQSVGVVLLALVLAVALNSVFGSALILLTLLGIATAWFFLKIGFKEKELYILFSIVLFIYFVSAVFIHYTQFYPFGGGDIDERVYHAAAVAIADDLRHGDFSIASMQYQLAKEDVSHWFPVLAGFVYAATLSDVFIGTMLSVWFVGFSAILLYLLTRELGSSRKWAFFAGFIGSILPTFLYFGSLLLRESIVVVLFLLALLFLVKIVKKFSWPKFLAVYVALGLLISLRFYVGFAILYAFALLLPWLGIPNGSQKFRVAFAIFIVLGFLPWILGYGYYGVSYAKNFLEPRQIVAYREFTGDQYIRLPSQATPQIEQETPSSSQATPQIEQETPSSSSVGSEQKKYDQGSLVIVKPDFRNPVVFAKTYLISFSYVLLGPFPWQIRYTRQLFALTESIPWLIAFFFIVKGMVRQRRNYRLFLPIILASVILIGGIALLINNYGTFMRIRIPAFLALLSLLPFAFQKDQKEVETV